MSTQKGVRISFLTPELELLIIRLTYFQAVELAWFPFPRVVVFKSPAWPNSAYTVDSITRGLQTSPLSTTGVR